MLLPLGLMAQSDTYRLQIGDQLQMAFWEYPELNTNVKISRDGEVILPIIGKQKAAGLTIKQLRAQIIRQMASYNRLVNQLTITVLEFGANVIHVHGLVASPGRYAYEEIPGIWEILLDAGGPLPNARLNNITVVRSQDNGRLININLTEALNRQALNTLPPLMAGDNLYIAGTDPAGNVNSPISGGISPGGKGSIYIVGEVAKPGVYQYAKNMSLIDLIAQAGGHTDKANLNKVTFFTMTESGTELVEINLKEYLEESQRKPIPRLAEGTTVYVSREREFSPFVTQLLFLLISTATTVAIVTALGDNSSSVN